MTQSAKAVEPSMEEILASIRRIIADDDSSKPTGKAVEAPKPAPARPAAAPVRPAAPAARPVAAARPASPAAPAAEAPGMNQDDIDAMLAGLDAEAERKPAANGMRATNGEILDLTESMAAAPAQPEPPAGFGSIDSQSDLIFKESAAARPAARADRSALLSATTSAAVDSAFNSLAESVLVQNARTLEDLVREMLRPMLKAWLDDNLPGLVERMVRAEIERVSRGRL
jgi:cell pole-organizing protein PopZ